MDVVSSISTAIEITKKLRDLGKKVSEADFKMMLADLTDQLGDAKLSAANRGGSAKLNSVMSGFSA